MAESIEQACLPLDVVQIVLGYVQDTSSLAAARQACKSWLNVAAAAACTVKVALPSSIQDMAKKLELLHQVLPGLAGCLATIAPTPESHFTFNCLQALQNFTSLKQLEISYTDSVELEAQDLTHLAMLTGLTALGLHNASLPASVDSSVLTQLTGLSELSLIHISKVSALMTGDTHLQVLGRLKSLTQLVLQGRMCSTTDDGLLSLTGLSNLASLAISWVPWQSQISQRAALQLLANLKSLKSLRLGGAELLLPSAPYHPIAAPTGAPSPAAPADNNMLNINLVGQQHGGLIAAAVAAVARADGPRGATGGTAGSAAGSAAATQVAVQGEYMRKVLAARADALDSFKLQFNCCGTGVEKALLSIGDIRKQLTGLQWSYAKVTGPTSTSLLATCTNLRSLKLRLWYQDYNLTPFEFKLTDLTTLVNLRTFVIDKRPPFQQQLPAQQAAIKLPLTSTVLSKVAAAWPRLEKLQLGLARSDFGINALEGLRGFTKLKSLSVHCYDQGYDDGHYMLPIDVTSLPSSLVKLDLMHAELLNRSSSGSGAAGIAAPLSSAGGCSSSGMIRSSKLGVKQASSSSSKNGFAAASAFTSMLSESFSVLSRQGSAECSAAYLDRHATLRSDSTAAAAAAATPAARTNSLLAGASGQLVCAHVPNRSSTVSSRSSRRSLNRSASVDPSGSWLKDLLQDTSSRAAVSNKLAARDQSSSSDQHKQGLIRQPSLPPLPKQHSITPKAAVKLLSAAAAAAEASSVSTSMPAVAATVPTAASDAAVCSGKHDQQLNGHSPDAGQSQAGVTTDAMTAVPAPKPARLQNPFAAAAAAAAVHAEMGGCVTAVDPAIAAAAAAAAVSAEHPGLIALGPLMTEPVGLSEAAGQVQLPLTKQGSCGCGNRRSSGGGLSKTFSLNLGRHFGKSSKVAAEAATELVDEANCYAAVLPPASLPLLQHLQLKHCGLVGLCMDDIVTAPAELRSLQLIEVCGLTPRDVAMLPMLCGLQRLTLIAAKEDAWLGLAPLRILSKLPELRHLDWVVSERALPARSKVTDLEHLLKFPKLQLITLPTALGKCEQLHAVSAQLTSGCHVRLMSPAYCEHAGRRSGSKIGRFLGAASCLIPGTGHGH